MYAKLKFVQHAEKHAPAMHVPFRLAVSQAQGSSLGPLWVLSGSVGL